LLQNSRDEENEMIAARGLSLSILLFACVASAFSTVRIEATRKPNIVLMFVDNVGFGDFGCYGNPVVRTPYIDRFATQGVRCTDFYIGSPSCMPSRGGLMTGRHAISENLCDHSVPNRL
jgi:hypothetical protein